MAEPKPTILIVDDDPSQRKLLGGFVESLGFNSQQAASAEEALEYRLIDEVIEHIKEG